MKYFDRVRVISDDYEEYGIKRGDEGHILLPEIRYCCLILWTLFYAPIDLAFSAFSGSTEKFGSQRKKLLLMN